MFAAVSCVLQYVMPDTNSPGNPLDVYRATLFLFEQVLGASFQAMHAVFRKGVCARYMVQEEDLPYLVLHTQSH